MKMNNRLFVSVLRALHFGLVAVLIPSMANADGIGFINSTNAELRFVIDITGPNYKTEIKPHCDSQRTILDCENKAGLKPFEVWVEKKKQKKFLPDSWERIKLHYDSGGDKEEADSVRRKCGEVLWITTNNDEYWIKPAPNVTANHLPSEYRDLNDDTDLHHITFVNQTASEMIFKIEGTGDRSVEPYSAERKKCTPGKEYFFTVDKKQGGSNPRIHDRISANCGETLYLYHDASDDRYLVSKEKTWENPENDAPYVYSSKDFDASKINSCMPYKEGASTVLFAHGLNDSPLVWNTFAKKADELGWRVLRTVVSKNGSIKKRARMLNAYIMRVNEKCGIPDGSLRVIGHSMGGLDLRYLIHYQLPSAKKIEHVYTLATPHQGCNSANMGSGDAILNLKPEFMRKFNYWNPYCDEQKALADMGESSHRFQIDNRPIYLYAYRFNCDGKDNEGDGVVGWKKQQYGRHYTGAENLLKGKHAKTVSATACTAEIETEQVKILEEILNDRNKTETCD